MKRLFSLNTSGFFDFVHCVHYAQNDSKKGQNDTLLYISPPWGGENTRGAGIIFTALKKAIATAIPPIFSANVMSTFASVAARALHYALAHLASARTAHCAVL